MEAMAILHMPYWTTCVGGRQLACAHRLDVVAVGVKQERGVVGGAVVGAQPRPSVVPTSGLEAVLVEAVDGSPVGRAKRDMHARPGRAVAGREPKRRRIHWTEARARGVLCAQLMAERLQSRAVEAHARGQVLNLQAEMIVHG